MKHLSHDMKKKAEQLTTTMQTHIHSVKYGTSLFFQT